MVSSTWSSLSSLVKLAIRRPPGLSPGAVIPAIEVRGDIIVEPTWLADYRRLTGDVDSDVLPPCAPQVLAVGLHLQLLQDARFPLPALGMVHIDNLIEERRPLPATGTLSLVARIGRHRPHDKGVTFDIVTEARVGGSDGPPPWRSVMTALVRDPRIGSPQPKTETRVDVDGPLLSSSSIQVRADIGRRYAGIAGDANPIHLWAPTAKAFGFPRAIAHGMWTLARCLAEVSTSLPPLPRRTTVKFIRPVLLPSTILVEARRRTHGIALRVAPEKAGPPHLLAIIAPLSDDDG
jgi:acyl dehydratase